MPLSSDLPPYRSARELQQEYLERMLDAVHTASIGLDKACSDLIGIDGRHTSTEGGRFSLPAEVNPFGVDRASLEWLAAEEQGGRLHPTPPKFRWQPETMADLIFKREESQDAERLIWRTAQNCIELKSALPLRKEVAKDVQDALLTQISRLRRHIYETQEHVFRAQSMLPEAGPEQDLRLAEMDVDAAELNLALAVRIARNPSESIQPNPRQTERMTRMGQQYDMLQNDFYQTFFWLQELQEEHSPPGAEAPEQNSALPAFQHLRKMFDLVSEHAHQFDRARNQLKPPHNRAEIMHLQALMREGTETMTRGLPMAIACLKAFSDRGQEWTNKESDEISDRIKKARRFHERCTKLIQQLPQTGQDSPRL